MLLTQPVDTGHCLLTVLQNTQRFAWENKLLLAVQLLCAQTSFLFTVVPYFNVCTGEGSINWPASVFCHFLDILAPPPKKKSASHTEQTYGVESAVAMFLLYCFPPRLGLFVVRVLLPKQFTTVFQEYAFAVSPNSVNQETGTLDFIINSLIGR